MIKDNLSMAVDGIISFCFFFFKQKTAYEIDCNWSSDVCSSDLRSGSEGWCGTRVQRSAGASADRADRVRQPAHRQVARAQPRAPPMGVTMVDEVDKLVRPLVPGGVLAFDAGNSKTDVALVSAEGTVLGTARGGGFEPHIIGAAAAVDGLAPLVAAAAAEAGLAVGDVPLVQQISACLANADLPIEEERLAEAFESHGWATSVHVANDTFALLRAGVDEPRGVAVVCGAGINC